MLEMQAILEEAYSSPFTTKSDLARLHANVIAMCACEGLLTTKDFNGDYGNLWRITSRGLDRLENPHSYG